MENNTNQPIDLVSRLLEKGTKTIEKGVEETVQNKLQAGQSPDKILQDLLNYAQGNKVSNTMGAIADVLSEGRYGEMVGQQIKNRALPIELMLKSQEMNNKQQMLTPESQVATLERTKNLLKERGIEGSYGVTATGAPTISTYTDMGNGTELVYRNPVTGEEVPSSIALQDMAEGKGVYQVNQRIKTRAGLQEKPVVKTNDLSTEEKTYLVAAQRIGSTLDNVLSDFDTIYSGKDPKLAQQFMAEKVPFWMIPDKDVQQIKANINRLKADIPFLRGGKQLTATEAKRVDTMLNPFGKNRDVYEEDINRFRKEFMSGSDIMKYGLGTGLMKKGESKQSSEDNDISSMSDDELKAIIAGGK